MTSEITPDQPGSQPKADKNPKALWIPVATGLTFAILSETFLFIWSQSNSLDRRLSLDVFNPFHNFLLPLEFLLGFVVGLLPAIPMYLRSNKSAVTITSTVAIIVLVILFCGSTWISMWMINP